MKIAGTMKEFFLSRHIQMALVTGASIIALSYVSKRVLAEPMRDLYIAVPGLILAFAEGMDRLRKRARYTSFYMWMAGAVLATALIIALHLV
jgi:hypothetical protein